VLHVRALGFVLLLLLLLLLLLTHQLLEPAVVVQVLHEVGLERFLLILKEELALQVKLLLEQLLLCRLKSSF
jgi:hypothetical protein